jgi:uracil-DNA glycosylase
MDKLSRLIALGRKRRRTRWPGYNCIGDYPGGAYECDFVSPYTKTAGNPNASAFVLLQDWSSDERLSGRFDECARDLGYTPALPTNRNLVALLETHFGMTLRDVFATNVFPFVKRGGLSTAILDADLVRAAQEYAIPQIQIVKPLVAVCLGKATFNALRVAAGLRGVATLDEGIRSPFRSDTTQIWCQAHTGSYGRLNRNRGGIDRVTRDWARMAAAHNKALQTDERRAMISVQRNTSSRAARG